MIATAAVEQSGGVFAVPVIAWQDLALVVLGLLLLGLARVVVHRRRRAEDHAGEVPLIEVPMPAPPGQPPRPTWPTPVRQRRADARVSQESAAAQNGSTEVQAGLVRFHRPPEGTLQLLPGRLEIISGKEGVDEIRFVKVPGKEPVITFGRSPGEPHTHIELQSPTVSRKHAAMRFDSGSWHIANLSTTNPVIVRGKELTVHDAPIRLEDGDEVEMGEVVFRFHGRPANRRAAEPAPLPSAAADAVPIVAPAVASSPVATQAAAAVPIVPPAVEAAPVVPRVLDVAPRALEIEPPVTHAAEPARATPTTVRVEPVLHHAADRERPAEERHVWVELVDLAPANVGAPADVVAPAEVVAGAAEVNVDASAQRRSWAAGAPHQPVHAHTSRAHTLTGREIEIAQMVGERKSNKAIGDALAISARTVSTHLTNIFRKLDVTTRAELAEYVTKHRVG